MPSLRVGDPLLFWSFAATATLFIVLGGENSAQGVRLASIVLTGIGLLGLALYRHGLALADGMPLSARILLAGMLLLPLFQLLPLPPAIWSALSGRDLEHQVYALIGKDAAWLPLSIEPLNTMMAGFLMLALTGPFVVTLRFSRNEVYLLLTILGFVVAAGAAIGVIQYLSAGRALDFYGKSARGPLLGYFTNRNHMALFLAIGIPIFAGLWRLMFKRTAAALLMTCCSAILLMALIAATASRAGLGLGILSFLISIVPFVSLRRIRRGWRFWLAVSMPVILLIAGFMSSGVFQRVLGRYENLENDPRWHVWSVSAGIARDYFPAGAGFGTFENIFEKYEQIGWVNTVIMNHAHSDYIELVLEGGLLSLALMALFFFVLVRSMLPLTRRSPALNDVGAVVGLQVILLILLHSLADYPLRMPAIAVIFAVCMALLLRRPVVAEADD